MNSHDFAHIVPALERLYVELHPLLVRHWGDSTVATRKSDGSWVTVMDKMVEEKLQALFAELLPEAFYLGEESYDEAIGSEKVLLKYPLLVVVDPIDGTHEYVTRKTSFGTLLGIYAQNDGQFTPLFGAVFHPISGEQPVDLDYGTLTFTDNRGITVHHLSRKDISSETIDIRSEPLNRAHSIASVPRVVTSRPNDRFSEHVEVIKDYVSIVDLIRPLNGEAEAAVSTAKFWDIGGPIALSRMAGMKIIDLESGAELDHLTFDQFVLEGPGKWRLKRPLLISHSEVADRIRLARP